MNEDNVSRAWAAIYSSLKEASEDLRRHVGLEALAIAKRKNGPVLLTCVTASLYDIEPELADAVSNDIVPFGGYQTPEVAPQLYSWLSSAQFLVGSSKAKETFSRLLAAIRNIQGYGVYTRPKRLMHQADDLLKAASTLGGDRVRRVIELLIDAIDAEQDDEYVTQLAKVGELAHLYGEDKLAEETTNRALQAARRISDPSDRSSALNSIAHGGKFEDSQLAALFHEALTVALGVPSYDRRADLIYYICWSASYRLDAVRAPALFHALEAEARDVRIARQLGPVLYVLAHSASKTDEDEARRLLNEALDPSVLAADDADLRVRSLLLESRAAIRTGHMRRARETLASVRLILTHEFSPKDTWDRTNWWSAKLQLCSLSRPRILRQDSLPILQSALQEVPPGAVDMEPGFLSSVTELAIMQQTGQKRAEAFMAIGFWQRHTPMGHPGGALEWVDEACAHLPIRRVLAVLRHLLDDEFFSGNAFGAVFLRMARSSQSRSDRRLTRALLAVSSDVLETYQRMADTYHGLVWNAGRECVANAILVLIADAISAGSAANMMPVPDALSGLTDLPHFPRHIEVKPIPKAECYVARSFYLLGRFDEWQRHLDRVTAARQPPILADFSNALADPPNGAERVQSALEKLASSNEDETPRAQMLSFGIEIVLDALDGLDRIRALERIAEIAEDSLSLEQRTPVRLQLAKTFASVGDLPTATRQLIALLDDVSKAGWGDGGRSYLRHAANIASRFMLKDVLVATSVGAVEPSALSIFSRHAFGVLRHAVEFDMATAAEFLQGLDRWRGGS